MSAKKKFLVDTTMYLRGSIYCSEEVEAETEAEALDKVQDQMISDACVALSDYDVIDWDSDVHEVTEAGEDA